MELDTTSNRLEYSLNFRLFRAKYFAVLVARNVSYQNTFISASRGLTIKIVQQQATLPNLSCPC